MNRYWAAVILAAAVLMAGVGGVWMLSINYSYNWNQACAAHDGVKMHNLGGTTICVEGPVHVHTIAVKPW